MESYTKKTKIALTNVPLGPRGTLVAETAALVATCGALRIAHEGVGLEFTSENPKLFDRLNKLLSALYVAGVSGRTQAQRFGAEVYTSIVEPPASLAVLRDTGLLDDGGGFVDGIPPALVDSLDDKKAYLRGAFLGGGLLSFGTAGYLLEFGFLRERVAEAFLHILNELALKAHVIERANRFVVYVKDAQDICDCMAHIGATRAVIDIQAFRAEREVNARAARAANCDARNAAKLVEAAQRSVEQIEKIRAAGGFDTLPDGLRAVAQQRLDDPCGTLAELAAALGISKSCAAHRLRKLAEIANAVDGTGAP